MKIICWYLDVFNWHWYICWSDAWQMSFSFGMYMLSVRELWCNLAMTACFVLNFFLFIYLSHVPILFLLFESKQFTFTLNAFVISVCMFCYPFIFSCFYFHRNIIQCFFFQVFQWCKISVNILTIWTKVMFNKYYIYIYIYTYIYIKLTYPESGWDFLMNR